GRSEARQTAVPVVAGETDERLCRRCTDLAPAIGFHVFVMLPVDSFPVLALVCEESGLLLLADGGDVHIVGWRKPHRLRARINLKEVETARLLRRQIRPERQQ